MQKHNIIPYLKIKMIDFRPSERQARKQVSKLVIGHCRDKDFEPRYDCNNLLDMQRFRKGERQTDQVYIAIDKRDSSIAGFIAIVVNPEYWILTSAGTRAAVDQTYRGTGSMLLSRILQDLRNSGTPFMIIRGYSPSGWMLYSKFGFKLCSQQGTICYSVSGEPIHPNLLRLEDLRSLQLMNRYFEKLGHHSGWRKLNIKQESDTYEYRQKMYDSSYSLSYIEEDANEDDLVPEKFIMRPTTKMLHEIQSFPKAAYKYSRGYCR